MNITTDELAQRIAIMAVCWAGSSANRRQAAPAVALRGIDQYEEEHATPPLAWLAVPPDFTTDAAVYGLCDTCGEPRGALVDDRQPDKVRILTCRNRHRDG